MKKWVFYSTLIFLSVNSSFADIKALTGKGEIVILNENGTWRYEKETYLDSLERQSLSTNKPAAISKYSKSSSSIFNIKSSRNNFGTWINPKKWEVEEHSPEKDREFRFKHKEKYIWAMAITEEIEIGIDLLIETALENAKDFAPSAEIINLERRIVNGHEVVYLEISAKYKDTDFVYAGYYHSSIRGTTQFITWTSKNLFIRYKEEINEFLNGFDLD